MLIMMRNELLQKFRTIFGCLESDIEQYTFLNTYQLKLKMTPKAGGKTLIFTYFDEHDWAIETEKIAHIM